MLQIELQEWDVKSYRDTPELRNVFVPSHLHPYLEKLSEMLRITELREGLSIEASSYVGRIQIAELQIKIQPKIDLETLMSLLRYAYNLRDIVLMEQHRQTSEQFAFQDILILQLLAEIHELWARGLKRDYLQYDESLSNPKGRLNIQAIARQGGILEAKLHVSHYPRSQNTILNQVLLGGLYLAANLSSELNLKTKARRLARLLEEAIQPVPLSNQLLAEAYRQLNRLNRIYEPALVLIKLLLNGQGISLEDKQSLLVHGFLFDMNLFWEKLLSRFLRENLPNYTVHDQLRLHGLMTYSRDYNPQRRKDPLPRPDYVITENGKLVAILDAKYRDIWTKGLPRDMLYQLGIYALSQRKDGKATILYPTSSSFAGTELIEIKDPLRQSYLGSVRLQPVHLKELSAVIMEKGHSGNLARQHLAFRLISFPS